MRHVSMRLARPLRAPQFTASSLQYRSRPDARIKPRPEPISPQVASVGMRADHSALSAHVKRRASRGTAPLQGAAASMQRRDHGLRGEEFVQGASGRGGSGVVDRNSSVASLTAELEEAGKHRNGAQATELFAELSKQCRRSPPARAWAALMQAHDQNAEHVQALYDRMQLEAKFNALEKHMPLSMLIACLSHHSRIPALLHALESAVHEHIRLRLPVLGMACVALIRNHHAARALHIYRTLISLSSARAAQSQIASTAGRVAQAFARAGEYDMAQELVMEAIPGGSPLLLADIIETVGRGALSTAEAVYTKLGKDAQESAVVSAAMVRVLAKHMRVHDACALHAKMEARGAEADAATLLVLVRGCGETGEAAHAVKFFDLYSSRTASVTPQAHFLLITALCRARAPQQALRYAKEALDKGVHLPPALLSMLQRASATEPSLYAVYSALQKDASLHVGLL